MRMLYPKPVNMDNQFWFKLLKSALRENNTSLSKRIIIKQLPYMSNDENKQVYELVKEYKQQDVLDVLTKKYQNCIIDINNLDDCDVDLYLLDDKWYLNSREKIKMMMGIIVYLQSLKDICFAYTEDMSNPEIEHITIKFDAQKQIVYPILDNENNLNTLLDIAKCNTKLSIIPISNCYVVDNKIISRHSNMLLIDNKYKTLEIFEPHGNFSGSYQGYFINGNSLIDNALKDMMNVMFPTYTFIPTLDYCPNKGPQHSENYAKLKGFTKQGFCSAFSMLYMHIRIQNTHLSRSEVIQQIMKGGKLQTYQRILKYAALINIYTL